MFKFNLNDKLRDSITGFAGVVISRTEWHNGCTRYNLQPDKLNKEGGVPISEVFDEQQLELVKATAKPKAKRGGGPMPDQKSPVRD